MRAWVEERNGVIFPDPAMQLVLMHERGTAASRDGRFAPRMRQAQPAWAA